MAAGKAGTVPNPRAPDQRSRTTSHTRVRQGRGGRTGARLVLTGSTLERDARFGADRGARAIVIIRSCGSGHHSKLVINPPFHSSDPVSSSQFICGICGATDGTEFTIREMMFGTRDPFRYVQCQSCEALQLQNPPSDWSRYYRDDYYAQGVAPQRSGVRRLLRVMRNRGTFLRDADPLSRALAKKMPYPIHGAREWFRHESIARDSRILDVGCGDGMIVQDLSEIGFQHVTGIDPFLTKERDVPGGGKLRRATVAELAGTFDIIMLHHSLEHAPSQIEMLTAVARQLAPDGLCVVRIPIVTSWAWQHYSTNWVQADAPRHYCLHSLRSLALLAAACNLRIERVAYDSTGFQIAGSELYARDLPLTQLDTAYTTGQRHAYDIRAQQLNRDKLGDQVVCYLRAAANISAP